MQTHSLYVKSHYCNCHPETCNCNDYDLFFDDERIASSMQREPLAALVKEFNARGAEIARLRDKLDAVRQRCEANNWMGTAKLCSGE